MHGTFKLDKGNLSIKIELDSSINKPFSNYIECGRYLYLKLRWWDSTSKLDDIVQMRKDLCEVATNAICNMPSSLGRDNKPRYKYIMYDIYHGWDFDADQGYVRFKLYHIYDHGNIVLTENDIDHIIKETSRCRDVLIES